MSRAGQEIVPHADSSKNIAQGRPYTLNPTPHYKYCSDAEDTTQLTDGHYTKGRFWTQSSTVGWSAVKYARITIDLGAVHPIRGVSYNTAAGCAGVQWPLGIYIFVSDDGKDFYEAGELVSLSNRLVPSPHGNSSLQVHRYWTNALATHGRYLSLLVLGEPYIFVDEIEVYEGNPNSVDTPFSGNPVSDFQSFISQKRVNHFVKERLQSDIHGIRDALTCKSISPEVKKAIAAQLEFAEQDLLKTDDWYHKDFQAVMPLNTLHESIFKIQAQLWRSMGLPRLSVWQSGLWDPLQPTHCPTPGSPPSVQVDMMLNEYRAGAFNISNASDETITLRLTIDGLPGGLNPSYVTVHEVAWTGTSGGECFASALPEAEKKDGAFLIHSPSGLTRQVWLTFHPTDIEPGIHHGKIALSEGDHLICVPIVLRVYPFHFPAQPTLHLGGWDYTNMDTIFDITPVNRGKVIDLLRAHFVDSPWATAAVLPFGNVGADGSYQTDTTAFDSWIQSWPGARQYCVFVNAGNELAGAMIGTPQFSEKVQQWIRFWADHLRICGLTPDQLHLLLVDEPSTPQQDETILQWALAIRAAKTGIKIWEDPVHSVPSKANQSMMDVCDVLCPERWNISLSNQSSRRDYFIQKVKQGLELALYSCRGPAHELDPYVYYRLQAWACWEYGARSSFFWAFSDAGGGSSWNEYSLAKSGGYIPFFLDPTSVATSKQMEAIREGIQDYEYLVLLREHLNHIEGKELHSEWVEIIQEAKHIVDDAAKEVCTAAEIDSYCWKRTEARDRSEADRIRIQILSVLAKIVKAEGK